MKFFRRNRRKMLQNGEIQKYLRYATGEIILVVLGILIALSINDCHTNRMNHTTELQIYQNIKNQINEDKAVIQGVSNYNDNYLDQYKFASGIIENNNRQQIDTLKQIAMNLFRYSDFNRSSNIYQTMVNSGQLKLLKNQDIIIGLQDLEESYIYMNRMEENHFKVILQFVGPGILDNINLSNGIVERPEELYSFGLQNIFISFLDIMREKKQIYSSTIDKIDTITKMIEEGEN